MTEAHEQTSAAHTAIRHQCCMTQTVSAACAMLPPKDASSASTGAFKHMHAHRHKLKHPHGQWRRPCSPPNCWSLIAWCCSRTRASLGGLLLATGIAIVVLTVIITGRKKGIQNKIHCTYNGGSCWTAVQAGLHQYMYTYNGGSCWTAGLHQYMYTYNGGSCWTAGLHQYMYTYNGGSCWTAGLHQYMYTYNGGSCWTAGLHQYMYTYNGGSCWTAGLHQYMYTCMYCTVCCCYPIQCSALVLRAFTCVPVL